MFYFKRCKHVLVVGSNRLRFKILKPSNFNEAKTLQTKKENTEKKDLYQVQHA